MKKLLNLVLALAGLALLAFLVLLEVNSIHAFVAIPVDLADTINYVVQYGAMAVLGVWVLVYFAGKGVLRVLLVLITLIVLALGVIAFGFPDLITQVFGTLPV